MRILRVCIPLVFFMGLAGCGDESPEPDAKQVNVFDAGGPAPVDAAPVDAAPATVDAAP